jgi:membrane protease YdiL (CAAX protease family)
MWHANEITSETPTALPPLRKGHPLLAWLVILAAIAFILWHNETAGPLDHQQFDLVVMRLEGRYLVGLAHLDKLLPTGGTPPKRLYEESQRLNRGPYPQRLRFVVLAGELKGPSEAREQLHRLNERFYAVRGDPSREDARTAELLDRLYALRAVEPKAASSLPRKDQEELRQRLGWFGDLALTPAEEGETAERQAVMAPAYRATLSLFLGGVTMLGLGFVGLLFLVTFLVLYYLRCLASGLTTGSPHGGIYAETFAVYLLLFLGLSAAGRYSLKWLELRQGALTIGGLAALGSLAALAWPMLRGLAWRQVRRDIGWTTGRGAWLEPLFGVGGYLMALPMLLLALGLILLLTKLRDLLGWGPSEFDPSNAPAHPIIFWVSNAGWWVWLEVLFVASVVAPVVEETMFRGVLYLSLRETSSRLRPGWSILASALLTSFLFAVIHPQGFLGLPPLMALALCFTLLREWRGTLLPSMIAHGLNNAVATMLLFLLLR